MGNFVLMPKLGMTMTEGKIIKWLKEEGDLVEKGDYILEVETDKTSLEVDSLYSGILLKKYYEAGYDAPCNKEIAYIGLAGEDIPGLPKTESQSAAKLTEQKPQAVPAAVAKPSAAKLPELQGGYDYDLAIVGAGPGGYVAALRAAQLGAKVCVVEKDELGGTCLNRGCIPTKALYASAKRWKDIQNAHLYGFRLREAAFDFPSIMSQKDKTVKRLTDGVSSLMKKNKIDVIRGEASIEKEHEIMVGSKKITCGFTLLATGGRPASVLKNIAADCVEITDTDKFMHLKALPSSVVIVGGGIIGCEIGCILNAFGVQVTIVEMMPAILSMADADVAACLAGNMQKNGIAILTGTTVKGIEKKAGKNVVTLSNGDTIACEMILEAVGRQVNTDAFAALGIELTPKGYVATNEFMNTSLASVYAIGDVTGKCQLAHAASEQGILAAERMFGGRAEIEEQNIPSCIFTDLEIAYVGLTEAQAREQGLEFRTYTFPFSSNGKALTLGDSEGFVKVISDKRFGEILGVHIIGPEASSLIEEAVMAMRLEATAEYAGTTVHAHPTLSEALMEAFLGCSRGALHK